MPSDLRRAVRDGLTVLVCFAVAGLACAFLWHAWWTPAPEGFVAEQRPFFLPDDEFRGTATYVALAAPAGVLLGVLLTWLLMARRRADPVVVVASVAVGSAAAALVMALVGHALGPESARETARALEDGAPVRADLWVRSGAAWLAFPVGAVTGAFFVLLGGTSAQSER